MPNINTLLIGTSVGRLSSPDTTSSVTGVVAPNFPDVITSSANVDHLADAGHYHETGVNVDHLTAARPYHVTDVLVTYPTLHLTKHAGKFDASFAFYKGDNLILEITPNAFIYKGERITDSGAAHVAFLSAMRAMGVSP